MVVFQYTTIKAGEFMSELSPQRGNGMRRIAGMVAALSVSIAAMAQEYPSRPVKIVLPYPLGGPGDFISRTVGEKLQQKLGQPFLPEFRPGAGGTIAGAAAARATPDGYTLILTTLSVSGLAR